MNTKPETTASQSTQAWCAQRGHPWLTYNPQLDRTWCRCGQRQAAGEQPHDWDAQWELFHDHPRGAACRCYLRLELASRAKAGVR